MIKIDKEQAEKLYLEIKDILLSLQDERTFTYEVKKHNLTENGAIQEGKDSFYNEYGDVDIVNVNGQLVNIKISRYHAHKDNGSTDLKKEPWLRASITLIEGGQEQVVWSLKVESKKCLNIVEATSTEIPKHYLQKGETVEL